MERLDCMAHYQQAVAATAREADCFSFARSRSLLCPSASLPGFLISSYFAPLLTLAASAWAHTAHIVDRLQLQSETGNCGAESSAADFLQQQPMSALSAVGLDAWNGKAPNRKQSWFGWLLPNGPSCSSKFTNDLQPSLRSASGWDGSAIPVEVFFGGCGCGRCVCPTGSMVLCSPQSCSRSWSNSPAQNAQPDHPAQLSRPYLSDGIWTAKTDCLAYSGDSDSTARELSQPLAVPFDSAERCQPRLLHSALAAFPFSDMPSSSLRAPARPELIESRQPDAPPGKNPCPRCLQ